MSFPWSEFLMVGFGGALGSMARYGMWKVVPPAPGAFTWATFLVNMIGSFVLGVLVGWLMGRLDDRVRLVFFLGLLGGFTTFSTFTVDTIVMIRTGVGGSAVVNVVMSVGVGLLLAAVGLWIGETLNPNVG